MPKFNELTVRVYYEDTDCGNVVYYANYLRYMERGRTELLRDLGIELSTYHSKGLVFTVSEASVKYKRPARYNDLLTIDTSVKEVTRTTMTFYTEIRKDGAILATGEVKTVCVKTSDGTPSRMPTEIVEALSANVAGVEPTEI